MAKAKKQASTVQIQLAGEQLEDAGEDWDYRAAIQQIEQQDGARFQITRIAPKELHGFVGELLPAEFSAQTLLERFGPGTYRIRAIGPDNLFVPGGGRMTIGPPSSKPQAVSTPSQGAPDLTAILLQLDERRARETREQTDKWMRWTAILGPIVSPVLLKLLGGNSNTVTDVVTLVSRLKELEPKHSSDLDVFLKALEYARDNNDRAGGGGDGESWLGFAKEALSTVRPAVAGFFANPTPAAAITAPASVSVPSTVRSPAQVGHAPTSVGTVPAATSASPTPGSLSNGSENPMLAKLLQHRDLFGTILGHLAHHAAASSNPALYAEWALDQVRGTTFTPQDFYQFLTREDWWNLLAQFAPHVRPYHGWFSLFRDEALQMLVREFDVTRTAADIAPDSAGEALDDASAE